MRLDFYGAHFMGFLQGLFAEVKVIYMLDKRMFAGCSRAAVAVIAGSVVLNAVAGEAQAQLAAQAQSAIKGTAIASGQAVDYQTLYVDAATGSDLSGGALGQPLQTVTRALELAAPNTVIVLAPGRYTRSSGEVFPLRLKSGVTIQGTPGSRNRTAIIEGGGNFESPTRSQQNAAIVAADGAGIAQVAISNPDGYGVWVESASPTIIESAFVGSRQTGIFIASGSPRVQGSYFAGNKIAGLMVFGASSASIQNNTFDSTGDGIQVSDGATPEIVGNRITNNDAGLVVIGDANPLLRDNRIAGNRRNGVVAIAARTQEMMSSAVLATAETFRKAPQAAEPSITEPVTEPITEPIAVAPSTSELAVGGPGLDNLVTAEETTYTRVPQPADAVPGELTPIQTRLIRPTVQQSFKPAQDTYAAVPIPADAVPGEMASRSVSPLLSQLAPDPEGQSIPVTVFPSQSIEIADNFDPGVEADESEVSPNAGAPGSALAALRSGLSGGSTADMAIRPRAVTGENPDSPILRPRIRRQSEPENTPEPEPSVRPSAPINNNRLAVPNTSIPVGSGSSSTIFAPPTGGVGGPPAPPSRAQALGLYYRVFVDASDPFMQDEVKSVVPDSFRTRFEGRTVMQVGAFPTEDEAEDRQRLLEDNGLDARVEYIR